MSYPLEDPQLTASRAAPPLSLQAEEQYGTVMLGQNTFGDMPRSLSEFDIPTTGGIPTTGMLPISGGYGPPPTAPRGLVPPTQGRPLSPPATSLPFGSMVEGPQIIGGSRSRQSSQIPQTTGPGDGGGRLRTSPVDLFSSSAGLQPRTAPLQQQVGGTRSLPADRISQSGSPRVEDTRPFAASSPPAMFTTAAIPQMQAQESMASLQVPAGSSADGENELLQQRVSELTQQLNQSRAPQAAGADVAALQRRLKESEDSESNALRAHEARLHEINDLEKQLRQVKDTQSTGERSFTQQRQLEAAMASEAQQRQLEAAMASEASQRRKIEEQAAILEASQRRKIEEQAAILEAQNQELQRARSMQASQQNVPSERFASAQSQWAQDDDRRDVRELEKKVVELKSVEDTYQKQLQQDRRTIGDLQAQLEVESRSKDFAMGQKQSNEEKINSLEEELQYLRKVEVFHKNTSDLHFKEAARLKRLKEEDAPPPLVPHLPLKALEERVAHIACFTMIGICALPIMGAIAALNDENYVFWLGREWPWMVIGGCTGVFLLFAATLHGLHQYALPEHRSQFTMAFTWATFAALLGIMLVPLALMANKNALTVASTVSQGCMTAMPQSELLVDYSQVLYNIRLSENCTNAKSVVECKGFAANKYTEYLAYLESDFQCGPLCPENPPPARAIIAPGMFHTIPTPEPKIPPPPLLGSPLQNALNHGEFLQAVREHVHVHTDGERPVVMGNALPHMQARKLFSTGTTRMTCYPLIATRLQVLVSTFGGLWYWEGMGLIIISLLTSLYAGMYFALGKA